MKDLEEFIEQRLLWADTDSRTTTAAPTSNSSSYNSSPYSSHHPPTSPKHKKAQTPSKCASCGEAHWLGRCSAFSALPVEDWNRLVREKRLCLNCFSPTHSVRQCSNKHSCRHCSLRHHSLLHRESKPTASTSTTPPAASPTAAAVVSPGGGADPASGSPDSGYFTCTIVARVQHEGKVSQTRVLLDHRSGGSFISEELASSLKLPRVPQDKLFKGFSQGTVRSRFKVHVTLKSTTSSFSMVTIPLSVIPHALHTSPPAERDVVLDRAHDLGLTLSDSLLGGQVDVILGGEYPWDLCGESITNGPYRFIDTKFGYGAVGPLNAYAYYYEHHRNRLTTS